MAGIRAPPRSDSSTELTACFGSHADATGDPLTIKVSLPRVRQSAEDELIHDRSQNGDADK
jgi:hypothetical protein